MELAIELQRHSGGSDRYSVIGEPESRLPAAEDKLALRLEEQYQKEPAEQQYLIDVTASVPVAVPLLQKLLHMFVWSWILVLQKDLYNLNIPFL